MAATIIINRLTGAGPTTNDVTSINTRVSTSDNHYTTETVNPIPIPTAGTIYSYWAVTRLECTIAPVTLVDNVKWFTDSTNSLGTGVTMEVGTATGYTQASGTPGDTGDELTNTNYSTGTLTPTDPSADNAFAYDSGAPLSVTGSTSTTIEFGDRVVYQMSVGTSAGAGATAQETLTWQYDET